ncbi:UNVERIFIED_CONTAM: hypothetical protein Sradi_6053900 [Sesamum radiatum]|uniref:Uncharacterized protein n=1 Tax=Sesamum radiatum TaxID=300843 RepID=A0AAW2KJJ5_SESRA
MDVGSPGNGYDTINDFLKDDDTALPDDLDVGFIVNKDIVDDDVYSDSGVNDKSHLDLSEKEKPVLPSLSSTFRHYDVPGSPSEKVLESGFHHDTLDKSDNVGDRGKFHTLSYQSTDIHDIQPGHPATSNQQISSPTNKQTPSPTVPNQVDPPHAEPLILASSHGMELMSQHIENSPAEHVIASPSSHYQVNGKCFSHLLGDRNPLAYIRQILEIGPTLGRPDIVRVARRGHTT